MATHLFSPQTPTQSLWDCLHLLTAQHKKVLLRKRLGRSINTNFSDEGQGLRHRRRLGFESGPRIPETCARLHMLTTAGGSKKLQRNAERALAASTSKRWRSSSTVMSASRVYKIVDIHTHPLSVSSGCLCKQSRGGQNSNAEILLTSWQMGAYKPAIHVGQDSQCLK
jgi:hypothetical protein